jgi:hypothetical protein
MSYWLEIHCDCRRRGQAREKPHVHRCYSNRGDDVGAMFRRMNRANLRALEAEAKSQGWKVKQGSWCCPGCLKP